MNSDPQEPEYSQVPNEAHIPDGVQQLYNKSIGEDQVLTQEYRKLKSITPMGQEWYQATEAQLKREKQPDSNPNVKFSTSYKPENVIRNRYTDVPCIEETRVKIHLEKPLDDALTVDANLEKRKNFMGLGGIFNAKPKADAGYNLYCQPSDYLNANVVSGYESEGVTWRKHYIAAQGPTELSVGHFWEAICQRRVSSIVMTTQTVERKRQKCEQYWPLKVGDVKTYPTEQEGYGELNNKGQRIEITCKRVLWEEPGSYKFIELEVEWQRPPKPVTKVKINHCHFIDWPDHGIPDSARIMIDFVKLVRRFDRERTADYEMGLKDPTIVSESQSKLNTNPTLVHCSAGIGRTGTYIVIDQMLHHFQRERDGKSTKYEINADFLKVMSKEIREQRALAIQTVDQYRFCYKAVSEIIKEIYPNRTPTRPPVPPPALYEDPGANMGMGIDRSRGTVHVSHDDRAAMFDGSETPTAPQNPAPAPSELTTDKAVL